MPWTKRNYPVSMKNLPEAVRNKAIDIANALYDEKNMPEGIMIATAISRAKDWASNRGMRSKPKKGSVSKDVKKHGQDVYVIPAPRNKRKSGQSKAGPSPDGWAVKKEKGKRKRVFDTKKEAVKEAREEAKKANASLTIQRKDGKIDKRTSYNPNRKQPKQTT
jgi:uncharacterized protein YdaT